MGSIHTLRLARLEMDTHQHRGTLQIFPRENT